MKGKPLSETHPELAAQAVGWDPTEVTPGSGQKRLWRCTQSHEWEAQILNRVNGTGCPYCAGRLMTGVNDLATTHPELANEADGWNPTLITAGSGKKVNWKCEYGHQWKAAISNRVNGTGCPVCAGRKVVPGFNDFATLNPELALEADGWDPTTVLAGTHTKYSWSCPNGHNYSVSPGERQIGRGCPVCAGKRVVPGFNDFATLNPELALEADGWDPTTVTAHSKKKLPWRCHIGHNFLANTQGRSDGEGCPVCAGKQVLIGFNDLATLNPELALEADGWDPTTVTAGSNKKQQWMCEFGHKWNTAPSSRKAGRGCPSCATTGFDPNADGWLYFLSNELWGLLQIGITNDFKRRLKEHGAQWDVVEVRGPMPGGTTYQWEQDVLHSLKRRGVELAPEHIAGKFSGYTEAWVQEDFPAKSLTELMNLVHEDEE